MRATMAALVAAELNREECLDYEWAANFSDSLVAMSQLQQKGSTVSEGLSRYSESLEVLSRRLLRVCEAAKRATS